MNRRSLLAAGVLPILPTHATLAQDDITARIAAEGSLAIYDAFTNIPDQLADQFTQFIAATYGVSVSVSIDQTTPLEQMVNAVLAGTSTVDVITTTADVWMATRMTAQANGIEVVEEFLPSDLIPNYDRS